MSVPTPNSATGGFLTPSGSAPLYGDALDDLFHDTIRGVLGWGDDDDERSKLIRPRWQPDPPNIPQFDRDWVAFGLTLSKRDWDAYKQHDPDYYGSDGGADVTQQDEVLELFLSYYGANAMALSSQWEGGLQIDQNRSLLEQHGIKWIECHEAHQVPALLKDKWQKRVDQRVVFRRRLVRAYPILNLARAAVRGLDNEQYVENIDINPPS